MGNNYNIIVLISILLGSSLILSLNAATLSSSVIINTTYVAQPTGQQHFQGALTAQNSTSYPLSPASQVDKYNAKNALLLLTCPFNIATTPEASNPLYLFTTTPAFDYGQWASAGNSCQLPVGNQQIPVNITLTATPSPPIMNGLPSSSTDPVVKVSLQNAVKLFVSNIGFSPEVATPTGNYVSTAYNTQTNIFSDIPVSGQQGLWTWYGLSVDAAQLNNLYQNSQRLELQTETDGNIYTESASCSFSYSIISTITLTSIGDASATYPTMLPSSGPVYTPTDIIPFLTYDAKISNPNPGNEFNTAISYDIFSPQNYQSPYSENPFPLNSLSLFLSGTTPSSPYGGNLIYYSSSGVGFSPSSANQVYGLEYPLTTSSSSASSVSTGSGPNQCPNQVYPSGDTTDQLTVDQAVACAELAGFTGQALVNFVEIGYEESSWHPGETEFGQVAGSPPACKAGAPGAQTSCAAAGILQEGCASDSWCVWAPGSFSPSSCSTYGTGPEYEGVYLNPECAYQWAYAYYSSGAGYEFWGGTSTSCNRDCNTAVSEAPGLPAQIAAAIIADGKGGSGLLSGSSASTSVNPIVDAAVAIVQENVPYCYGGTAPSGTDPGPGSVGGDCNGAFTAGNSDGLSVTSGGFDCSGLVYWIYDHILGFQNFPRSTLEEWADTASQPGQTYNGQPYYIQHITQAQAQPGDLIWFWSGGDGPAADQPGHVGICVNIGCTEMINSPETGCYVTFSPGCSPPLTSAPGASSSNITSSAPCLNGSGAGSQSFCVMGYGHVVGAPTQSGAAGGSQQPNVFTTSLKIRSVAAIPSGYIFALGSIPSSSPAAAVSTSCVSVVASNPTPATASVTGGATAYFTEAASSSGSTGTPTTPITYSWYTGSTSTTKNTCAEASCPSAGDCNPAVVHTNSSQSDTAGINVGNTNANCDVWVTVSNACTAPASKSGDSTLTSTKGGQITVTTPGNSSSSGAGSSSMQLFVMKAVPPGEFNASEYQPNTVVQAGSQGSYSTNWDAYWNNTLKLQGSSVYVLKTISFDAPSFPTGFTPQNITSDNYGDIFMTGTGTYTTTLNVTLPLFNQSQLETITVTGPVIVKIANTIGPGPVTYSAAALCPGGNAPSGAPGDICNNQWPEIAVSPDGAQIYLANQESGVIPIFSGTTLQYTSQLGLSFSNDNSLIESEQGKIVSPLGGPAGANIIGYFQSGGLYGINPNCGPQNSVHPDLPVFFPGPGYQALNGSEPCTPAENSLKQVLDWYWADQPSIPSYHILGLTLSPYDPVDYVDRAAYPGSINSNFHHPMAITDVNGYLYVLDNWAGTTGEQCTLGINSYIFGAKCLGGDGPGVSFDILMLRAINSSGVDVPVNPTYTDDIWYYTDLTHSTTELLNQTPGLLYPPYGWVLTANVSFTCDGGNDGACTAQDKAGNTGLPHGQGTGIDFNVCGGNSSFCFQPDQSYLTQDNGTLLPVGPLVASWECFAGTILSLGAAHSCAAHNLIGATMSTGFNDTLAIFIPGQAEALNLIGDSHPIANLEGDDLILATFGTENYTKPVGGYNNVPFNYNCYYGKTAPNSNGAQLMQDGLCQYVPSVSNITSPIYYFANPFEYDSNLGGYQGLSLASQISSDLSSGSASNQKGAPLGTTPGDVNNFASSLTSNFSTQYSTVVNPATPSAVTPTTLTSQIKGYLLMPYQYTYTDSWYVTNIQPQDLACPGTFIGASGVPAVPTQNQPEVDSKTVYNYTTSLNTKSNSQHATVEGGSTYASSAIYTDVYYEASLGSLAVPQQLFYNLLNERIFGDVYVNATYNPLTNRQAVINATNRLSYSENTFTQGLDGAAGYAVVSAVTNTSGMYNSSAGTPACIGPLCTYPQLTNKSVYPIKNSFSTPVHAGAPSLITLFDWYKIPTFNSGVFLTVNGSSGPIKAYGYHRFVYVYNDQFNNTIYMPLDVDVANITQLNLTVIPSINQDNSNQTSITVNGTAYWVPPFSTTPVPVRNGKIYLYYDANLNFIGFNSVEDPLDAQVCAFHTGITPPEGITPSWENADNTSSAHQFLCWYSNPVYNGLQDNPPFLNESVIINGQLQHGVIISPNTITYHTAYNSSGNSCPAAPSSLLTPRNKIYQICNIYGSLAETNLTNPQTPLCPMTASGNTQYCDPVYENGTGVCTPQLGLFDVATTNSSGFFSNTILACGVGTHDIIAEYYGASNLQPIYAQQSGISTAYDPSIPSSQSISFQTFNYSWTPIAASQTIQVGTILLSLGNLSAPIGISIIVLLGLAIALVAHMRKSKKAKSSSSRRKSRKSG